MKKLHLIAGIASLGMLLSLPTYHSLDFHVAVEPVAATAIEADYGFTAFTSSFITTRGTEDPTETQLTQAEQISLLAAYE